MKRGFRSLPFHSPGEAPKKMRGTPLILRTSRAIWRKTMTELFGGMVDIRCSKVKESRPDLREDAK